MESVVYSWLAAAALAPFVGILSCWTLVVFRSYRREWRLVDLFLFALTSLEVASALFGFGFSILSVVRPAVEGPCGIVVWGLVATRCFHLSAVTSLLLDRALSSKWPYTYRSSVRQSQVRYHIVVLAIISVFVGITAAFARLPTSTCSLHPLEWEMKFSIFLTSVYGVLLLTGFVCCLVVQVNRFRSQGSYRTAVQGWDSGTNNSRSTCVDSKEEEDYSEAKDLEWALVACVCWLSYMLNHAPFVVLSVMGMAVPTFWSPWVDNGVIWLRLVQGALVPFLLLIADLPHRSALRNMLRQPGRIYRHLSDHGGFRLQIGEPNLKSGFLPPLVAFPKTGNYHLQTPFQIPGRLRWSPTATLPSLQALQPATHLDADSLHKPPLDDFENDAPLGLFVNHPFNSFSSSRSSTRARSEDGISITTDAVDDFVYHNHQGLALIGGCYGTDQDSYPRRDTPTPFASENVSCNSEGEDDENSEKSSEAGSVQSVVVLGRHPEECSTNLQMADAKNFSRLSDEKNYGQRVIYSEYL